MWKMMTTGLCNTDAMCFLWGRSRMFKCYFGLPGASKVWRRRTGSRSQ